MLGSGTVIVVDTPVNAVPVPVQFGTVPSTVYMSLVSVKSDAVAIVTVSPAVMVVLFGVDPFTSATTGAPVSVSVTAIVGSASWVWYVAGIIGEEPSPALQAIVFTVVALAFVVVPLPWIAGTETEFPGIAIAAAAFAVPSAGPWDAKTAARSPAPKSVNPLQPVAVAEVTAPAVST